MQMTAVGFKPTPFRNGALSHRLRPLGQTVMFGEPGPGTLSLERKCSQIIGEQIIGEQCEKQPTNGAKNEHAAPSITLQTIANRSPSHDIEHHRALSNTTEHYEIIS